MTARLAYLAGALALAALGVGAVLIGMRPDPGRIQAIGGTWQVTEETWHVLSGSHRGRVVLAPEAVDLENPPLKTLLGSLCNAFVQARQDSREGDIYRVDVNFLLLNGNPALDQALPIVVRAGQCDLDLFGDQFFSVYPGPLSGWHLSSSGFSKAGDAVLRTVIFQPNPGAEAALADFPFAFACAAVLQDPFARRAFQVGDRMIPAIGDGPLVIRAQQAGGAGQPFRDQSFTVSGDSCEVVAG